MFTRIFIPALSIAFCLGCTDSMSIPCYPVSGVVLIDDKPLAEAEVVFHPLTELERKFPKPIAQTDAEGRFRLTTSQPRDGAPAGDYLITVEFREQRLAGEELVRDGVNLLPPRYASPTESGLRFSVTTSPSNEVPPLRLENR